MTVNSHAIARNHRDYSVFPSDTILKNDCPNHHQKIDIDVDKIQSISAMTRILHVALS